MTEITFDLNIAKTPGYSHLCQSMQVRAQRYIQRTDQQRSAAAYTLLSKALRHLNINQSDFGITTNKSGKPYLTDYPNIHFSLSHSGSVAACVVSDKEVGIDIEDSKSFDATDLEEMAKLTMNEKEQHIIAQSTNPAQAFLLLWTRKEAILKLTGEGLRNNIQDVLTKENKIVIHSNIIGNRYIYSTAQYE
ncbi:MAG: 4'-phosphopantetheinyl transferase superfamily protein [Paludibacteraceae bacterium]|nr:4'-phosphopantetheinyl transferase superfamily protein [Paludibacteraceae bacterium]